MEKGSKVVVINGIWHRLHGVVADVLPDGNLKVWVDNEDRIAIHHFQGTVTLKPHDVELEEREDLYKDLI